MKKFSYRFFFWRSNNISIQKADEENINALKIMAFIFVSPGLLVKTYLQKFSEIIICISNMVISNGNWFFTPLTNIKVNPTAKEKKIMPIISDNPATA
jgi:hypothetical protein